MEVWPSSHVSYFKAPADIHADQLLRSLCAGRKSDRLSTMSPTMEPSSFQSRTAEGVSNEREHATEAIASPAGKALIQGHCVGWP